MTTRPKALHNELPATVPAELAELVRQFPTDATSALTLRASLLTCAPAQVTLTGATYKAVLDQGLNNAKLVTYSGPVGSAGPGGMSGENLRHYQLDASTGPDGLNVIWTGRGDATAPEAAGALESEQRAQAELVGLWASHPAHHLCQAASWLELIAYQVTHGTSVMLEVVLMLDRHLQALALLTLDPARRHVGQGLADGWTGTTAQLLDTIDSISAGT